MFVRQEAYGLRHSSRSEYKAEGESIGFPVAKRVMLFKAGENLLLIPGDHNSR